MSQNKVQMTTTSADCLRLTQHPFDPYTEIFFNSRDQLAWSFLGSVVLNRRMNQFIPILENLPQKS